MPDKPSPPPRFQGEEKTEEEQKFTRKEIEQAAKELREQEKRELEQQRGKIHEDIASGWDQLLEPQFEGKEKDYAGHFKSYLLAAVPIANIRREWIPRYLSYFDSTWLWMKTKGISLPPYLWASFRMVFELNLTRAIGGIQRELQSREGASAREIQTSIKQGWNRYIEPDFEGTELENYSRNFSSALSNVVPLANIREGDINSRYLLYFDEIWQFMKVIGVKIHPQAWDNFRFTLEINLTKSIEAFEMKQQANTEIIEEKRESKGVLESLLDTLKGI